MKNKKIVLASLVLSLGLIAIVIKNNQGQEKIVNNVNVNENMPETTKRIIKVNDILYYDMEKESIITARCGVMDGNIISHVTSDKIPLNNNEANFEGDYGFQFENSKRLALFIDNKWQIFESPTFIRTYTLEHIKPGQEEDSYYLTLSEFQGETKTVLVKNFYKELEIDKTYEFDFLLNESNKDIEDSMESIFKNAIIVDVKKTDKLGMDQIQDPLK